MAELHQWRTGEKIIAYALMAALAVASVWFIDRKVRHLPDVSASTQPTVPR
jgi:hypothetical protein